MGEDIFATMKKLICFCACLLALGSSPVMAQATAPTGVEVTVVRVTAGLSRTFLTVTRPGGKQEELEFDNYGKATEKRLQVGPGLQGLVTELYQQGYQLQSTFDTQTGATGSASILLFIRRKS